MIYQTPFDPDTHHCTGPSVPVGDTPLDALQMLYGEPLHRSPSWLIYPGICFGPVVMHVDGSVNSDNTAGIVRSPHHE